MNLRDDDRVSAVALVVEDSAETAAQVAETGGRSTPARRRRSRRTSTSRRRTSRRASRRGRGHRRRHGRARLRRIVSAVAPHRKIPQYGVFRCRPPCLLQCAYQGKEVVRTLSDSSYGTLEVSGR